MKLLNIISSGYRATLEEQDDTIVWLSHMLKTAGAEIDVLLRGTATNYLAEGQAAPALTIGTRTQANAPDVHGQLRALAERGVQIFVQAEDVDRRGLGGAPLLDARRVAADQLPDLIGRYDQVWHW